MGQVKQLLAFGETTVLGRVIENAVQSTLDEVVVVLGHAAERIRQSVALERVGVVMNEAHEQGQSSSLRTGLSAISDNTDGVMFILGDQPLVGAEVIDALIGGYCQTRAPIVLPKCREKRGNPVVIDRSLFPRVLSLMGDVGARVLFEEYAEAIVEVEMKNESILLDLDTWEDYERLRDGQESR
jgi:molybdenum cofactor cytidylyltransferase